MFFDSDDMLLPTALEVAVNLISSGTYDCAMFDFTQIGLDGTRLTMMRKLDKKVHVPSFRPVFLARLYRTTLSSRFDLERKSDLKEYNRIFKPLKKKTFREYLTCPDISFMEKAQVVFLLSFPRLGRMVFRMKYR